ncbi:MAG: hypothetical protein PHE78_02740 [Candidatus Gastranaerophilales bacterium]|nr:hypothetical protein [Candidatus Gastranaerophilales bacterium]
MKIRKILLITTIAGISVAGAYKPSRSWIADKARTHFPLYSSYRKEGTKLANELGIKEHSHKDAFVHAYTSADIAYRKGEKAARILGDLNEWARIDNPPTDKYMDDFNNQKGIKIGRLLKEKGVPIDSLPKILKDSLNKGSFILDVSKVKLKK